MNIDKEDILSSYNLLKKEAFVNSKNREWNKSLELIESCAKVAYCSNYFYTDAELEALLAEIANNISVCEVIEPIKNRCVIIDTNGSDNHGLTQQYVRALIVADIEFAFIYEDTDLTRIKIILQELNECKKASVYTFEKHYSFVEKTKMILKIIRDYRPENYVMHIMPWDVVAVMICNLIRGVVRFNINLTDHAFWLGSSCIDYCIEFRNYGYTVSLERRGISENQLLTLPYYPVNNDISFQGFPQSFPNNVVKIFSGGNFYKIYGENYKYFEVVKRILTENPNSVLIYAGVGDNSKMKRFIKENDFKTRIFLLGSRKDIHTIFKACDIYLGTYPIGGGLMSQYAAVAGKPILSYTDPKFSFNFLEGVVCHQHKLKITFSNLDEFYDYASHLCKDRILRITKGQELERCVISEDLFCEEFKLLLLNKKSKRIAEKETVDYDSFADLCLAVENDFQPSLQKIVVARLKLKILYKSPKMFTNILYLVMRMALKKAGEILGINNQR